MNFKNVSCSNCGQKWCVRNGQFTTSKCRDHQINRKIITDNKKGESNGN